MGALGCTQCSWAGSSDKAPTGRDPKSELEGSCQSLRSILASVGLGPRRALPVAGDSRVHTAGAPVRAAQATAQEASGEALGLALGKKQPGAMPALSRWMMSVSGVTQLTERGQLL